MARSLIGITGQFEAAHWGDWVREAVLSPLAYTRAVERAGGTPVILPPVPADSVARLTQSLDGIVFTCGTDVNPALYDAAPHEKTDPPNRRRDWFEVSLVRAATDGQLPFLAICRGMHILNVARGGTLIQHLPESVGHDGHAPDPYKMAPHDVHLNAGSTVGPRLDSQARVRALHHQAVRQAGEGLVTVAWAETTRSSRRSNCRGTLRRRRPVAPRGRRRPAAVRSADRGGRGGHLRPGRGARGRGQGGQAASRRGGRTGRATAKARARI